MKILESQSAVLSNYEVYQHLQDMREQNRQKPGRRRGPGNLETLITEILQYLRLPPGPLSQQPLPYHRDSISQLLARLRDAELQGELTKGELIMILNLRPASEATLHTIIENVQERFTEEEQERILGVIRDVLGEFPPPADEAGADGADGQDGDALPSVENGAA